MNRRVFLALLSSVALTAWTHGNGQPGQNVVDDSSVLVVDDSAVQVVAS